MSTASDMAPNGPPYRVIACPHPGSREPACTQPGALFSRLRRRVATGRPSNSFFISAAFASTNASASAGFGGCVTSPHLAVALFFADHVILLKLRRQTQEREFGFLRPGTRRIHRSRKLFGTSELQGRKDRAAHRPAFSCSWWRSFICLVRFLIRPALRRSQGQAHCRRVRSQPGSGSQCGALGHAAQNDPQSPHPSGGRRAPTAQASASADEIPITGRIPLPRKRPIPRI